MVCVKFYEWILGAVKIIFCSHIYFWAKFSVFTKVPWLQKDWDTYPFCSKGIEGTQVLLSRSYNGRMRFLFLLDCTDSILWGDWLWGLDQKDNCQVRGAHCRLRSEGCGVQRSERTPVSLIPGIRMWNLVLHPWEPKASAFLSIPCVSCSLEPCVSVARNLPSSTPCLVGVTDGWNRIFSPILIFFFKPMILISSQMQFFFYFLKVLKRNHMR